MWTADNWTDYEVIDTGSGEKLERWGKYLLVRPDPQVIWESERKHPGWKKKNGHYHRSSRGGGEWEFFDLPQEWSIHYRELTFRLKPFSFKHTGLFPEQAVNWDWFSGKIRHAGIPGKVRQLQISPVVCPIIDVGYPVQKLSQLLHRFPSAPQISHQQTCQKQQRKATPFS